MFLCFLLNTGLWERSYAQLSDTTGVNENLTDAPRYQRMDTRSVSMAGATMADPNRVSSLNINPALIAFIDQPAAIEYQAYQNWHNNLIQQNLTLPAFRFENHTVVMQFAFTNNSIGYENPYREAAASVPNISMYDVALGYSISINEVISFGILNNLSIATNGRNQHMTYYTDLGVVYSPSEFLTYGLVFRGLGRSIIYRINENGNLLLDSQLLRQSLELGASLNFPVEGDRQWMTLSFSNEKLFGIRGIWYKGGLELKPTPHLALRSGLIFEPNEKFIAPRYGIGINSELFKLDYSISPKPVFLERFHQISLTLEF